MQASWLTSSWAFVQKVVRKLKKINHDDDHDDCNNCFCTFHVSVDDYVKLNPLSFFDYSNDNGLNNTNNIIVSSYETRHQVRYWGMVEVSYHDALESLCLQQTFRFAFLKTDGTEIFSSFQIPVLDFFSTCSVQWRIALLKAEECL